MAALCRLVRQVGKKIILSDHNRNVSLSATTRLKEIIEKKEGNTLIIEGVVKLDERDERLLKTKNGACPVCSSGLQIKHTDVLILSQFLRFDGCMLPQRITGLCKTQQKRIGIMVTMAQKAGLMPNKKDPKRRTNWKKFNTYYDENTIRYK